MQTPPHDPQPRRPWTPPALEVVGPVADLTKGPSGGNIDALVGNNGGFQTVS